jgi:hypothetical protein
MFFYLHIHRSSPIYIPSHPNFFLFTSLVTYLFCMSDPISPLPLSRFSVTLSSCLSRLLSTLATSICRFYCYNLRRIFLFMSFRNSSVGTVTKLRAWRPQNFGSISRRSKIFFSQHPDRLWGRPFSPSTDTGPPYKMKRQGRVTLI